MPIVTLLLGLPLAVYTLAGVFALVDFQDRPRALLLLTKRVLLNLLLLLAVGVGNWPWLAGAYAVVAALHLGAFVATRWAVRSGRWISSAID